MIFLNDAHTHISPYDDPLFGSGQDAHQLLASYDRDSVLLGSVLTSLLPHCPAISIHTGRSENPFFDYAAYDEWILRQIRLNDLNLLVNIDPRNPEWMRRPILSHAVGVKLHSSACHVTPTSFGNILDHLEKKIILLHSDDAPTFRPHEFLQEFQKRQDCGNVFIFAHCARFRDLEHIAEATNVFVDISGIQSPSVLVHALNSVSPIRESVNAIEETLRSSSQTLVRLAKQNKPSRELTDPEGVPAWLTAAKGFASHHVDAIAACLERLIDVLGESKILFGTDTPLFDPAEYFTILHATRLSETARHHVLWRNVDAILSQCKTAKDTITNDRIRLFLQFLPPYSSDSPRCTGVEMLRAGLAQETADRADGAILLTPHAEQPISRADQPIANAHGIMLMDSPWENLAKVASECKKQGTPVRRLPHRIEPANPFYRKENPLYYYDGKKFSTGEAAAYALATIGRFSEGADIAEKLGLSRSYHANTGRS